VIWYSIVYGRPIAFSWLLVWIRHCWAEQFQQSQTLTHLRQTHTERLELWSLRWNSWLPTNASVEINHIRVIDSIREDAQAKRWARQRRHHHSLTHQNARIRTITPTVTSSVTYEFLSSDTGSDTCSQNALRYEVKLHRTWSTTASWSRTPDALSFAPLTPVASVLTVPRTNTRLGDRSFSVAGPRIWNSLPTSMRQPDIAFWHFQRLLKAFLFGETAAHQWPFDFSAPCIRRFTYLLTYLLHCTLTVYVTSSYYM